MLPVENPYKTYASLDGKPLDNGYLYFGLPNQNPQTAQVPVFWDAEGTIPASQPLRTMNGFILRSGTPANIFVAGSYSMLVLDSKRRQVSYAPEVESLSASTGASQIGAQAPGGLVTTVEGRLFDEVKTADYPTFLAALNAASGKSLIVNSVVPIKANTTIPANVAVQVKLGGVFNIDGGVTLTVSGPLDAGEYQIFAGGGVVVFAVTSRARDIPVWYGGVRTAVFSTNRTLRQSPTEVGGPVHAFEDNATVNFTNPKAANFNAYAAFDANTTMTGAGAYDHMVGFQSRQTYSGSGEIWSRWQGFNFLATHNGTGRVAVMHGLQVENPLGSGQIDFLAGVLIQRLNRGGETWGFYSATGMNTISVQEGDAATWLLRGGGQSGGFGLVLQSAADKSTKVLNTANMPLFFGTNNVTTGACTADGRWKFTTVGLSEILTSSQQVEIAGTGGMTTKATGGAGFGCVLQWNSADTGNNLFSGFYTGATPNQVGSIDFNRTGGLTRYNTTSDGALKNIIGDASAEKSLQILASTRLRDYSWKNDPDGKAQIGVIAQELYETYPGAVSVGGEYEELVDGEKVARYRPWAVDKTAFTFHLIAGHQYQTKQIADLQKLVADLALRLAQLENKS